MSNDTSRRRSAGIALTLAIALLIATVAVTVPAAASLSSANATDIPGGMASTEQSLTIRGQATGNGETNYYVVDISDAIQAGATLNQVSFANLGSDGDQLSGGAPSYSPSTNKITFSATEDPQDADKKVDFELTLTLDTLAIRESAEMRYDVTQYESSSTDVTLSPQSAQFKLIGANPLHVETSNANASATDVTHTATHTLEERVRYVEYLTIHTAGADYSTLSAGDVTITRNGGGDLVSSDARQLEVSDGGEKIRIQLDEPTTFQRDDTVRIRLAGATNPGQEQMVTVAFHADGTVPEYVASGRLQLQSGCLASIGAVEQSEVGSPGFGVVGAVGALLVGAFLLGRRK